MGREGGLGQWVAAHTPPPPSGDAKMGGSAAAAASRGGARDGVAWQKRGRGDKLDGDKGMAGGGAAAAASPFPPPRAKISATMVGRKPISFFGYAQCRHVGEIRSGGLQHSLPCHEKSTPQSVHF